MLNPLKKLLQKLKKTNHILLLPALLFPASAFSEPLLVFLKNDQKKFSVLLKANPTTGYRWKLLNYDHTKLKFLQNRYIASQPQLMGSGGNEEFMFERLSSGPLKTQIKLRYQRNWEPSQGENQIVEISNAR